MDPIAELAAEVERDRTVNDSAATLIDGLVVRLNQAIEAAKNAGATAQQLAEVTKLAAQLRANSDALAARVQANTPATTPQAEPVVTPAPIVENPPA